MGALVLIQVFLSSLYSAPPPAPSVEFRIILSIVDTDVLSTILNLAFDFIKQWTLVKFGSMTDVAYSEMAGLRLLSQLIPVLQPANL